jgi:hypothetical protein
MKEMFEKQYDMSLTYYYTCVKYNVGTYLVDINECTNCF